MSNYLDLFAEHLRGADRSEHTVEAYTGDVAAFFARLAPTNPVQTLKGVKQDRRVPKALSAQEVYRLQRTASSQRQLAVATAGETTTPAVVAALRDEAVLNLLLYTGLRVGEAATLRLDAVVLNGKAGKVIVRSGNGLKYRELPLHEDTRQALAAYLGESVSLRNLGTF